MLVFVMQGRVAVVPCGEGRNASRLVGEDVEYVWYNHFGNPLTDPHFAMRSNGDLVVKDSQPEHNGRYECHVTITVNQPAQIHQHHLFGK
jgi:hypothetical protein